jgi:hypothetical protein
MCRLRGCVVLIIFVLSLADMASATEIVYRCADGTFTNRVDRRCQPYVSTGIVRVQGATVEAAKTVNESAKVEDNRR